MVQEFVIEVELREESSQEDGEKVEIFLAQVALDDAFEVDADEGFEAFGEVWGGLEFEGEVDDGLENEDVFVEMGLVLLVGVGLVEEEIEFFGEDIFGEYFAENE